MFFDRPESGREAIVLHLNFRQRRHSRKDSSNLSNKPSSNLSSNQEGKDTYANSASSMQECVELAQTASMNVVATITATRDAPHARWFVGKGKLEELKQLLSAHDADLLIVNHDLSAGQQRNLESTLDCRVITRTELILHIFADRARSYEGQLQVELAQLKHAQTRLVRGWTHLDRQKGGIGMRGAGETQLELDQRMLGERIKVAEKKLADVGKRRELGRRRRRRSNTLTISLVGYTNAGKSTLFNALTAAEVLTEDKLFATLDPTMRRVQIDGVGEVVLADTVGFISNLPHALIEAFKATLEEVAGADLLLHVVDASLADADEQVFQVNAVLREIGALDLPTIMVFNKIDALPPAQRLDHGAEQGVSVSALTGEGIDDLRSTIATRLGVNAPTAVMIPVADGQTRAWLYRLGAVIDERLCDDGQLALTLRADDNLLARLQAMPKVLLQAAQSVPKLSPSERKDQNHAFGSV